MFPAASLLSYLLLAVSLTGALASPVAAEDAKFVRLPINRRFLAGAGYNARRQGRSEASMDKRQASPPSQNTLEIGIGSPATIYNLLLDTRSGNTWVGAGTPYRRTSTSVSTGKQVSVTYPGASFSGLEYTDLVTFSTGLSVTAQSIGDASRSSGFDGVDGVLGFGPTASTAGTVQGVSTVPTVTDNLFSQGLLPTDSIGISILPESDPVYASELTLGGVDTTRYTGSLVYTSTYTVTPYNKLWAVPVIANYGGGVSICCNLPAVIDISSETIGLQHASFVQFLTYTGATFDSATNLLIISTQNLGYMLQFDIWVAGIDYALVPEALTLPSSLNTAYGGDPDAHYLLVTDIGDDPSNPTGIVLGLPFLQRYYVALDKTQGKIGLATGIDINSY